MASKPAVTKTHAKAINRTSVSFPADLYRTLAQIAEQKKVSVAWVIRDAAEKYISDRWPLLGE
ncbi:CopG family transcriptional regulator [Propionivibrio sp.]|uniref:ribbon-helix-helix domain-containing protein n=1 Tax=Propionivibrio sp. TaxID=2212460 RepID=UPI00345BFB7D|nr:ribbon-helix-helix protein, CopG family [Propionivibrio sp.]